MAGPVGSYQCGLQDYAGCRVIQGNSTYALVFCYLLLPGGEQFEEPCVTAVAAVVR